MWTTNEDQTSTNDNNRNAVQDTRIDALTERTVIFLTKTEKGIPLSSDCKVHDDIIFLMFGTIHMTYYKVLRLISKSWDIIYNNHFASKIINFKKRLIELHNVKKEMKTITDLVTETVNWAGYSHGNLLEKNLQKEIQSWKMTRYFVVDSAIKIIFSHRQILVHDSNEDEWEFSEQPIQRIEELLQFKIPPKFDNLLFEIFQTNNTFHLSKAILWDDPVIYNYYIKETIKEVVLFEKQKKHTFVSSNQRPTLEEMSKALSVIGEKTLIWKATNCFYQFLIFTGEFLTKKPDLDSCFRNLLTTFIKRHIVLEPNLNSFFKDWMNQNCNSCIEDYNPVFLKKKN